MAGTFRGSAAYWALSIENQMVALELMRSLGTRISCRVYDKLAERIFRLSIETEVRHYPHNIARGLIGLNIIRHRIRGFRDDRLISRYQCGKLLADVDAARAYVLQ